MRSLNLCRLIFSTPHRAVSVRTFVHPRFVQRCRPCLMPSKWTERYLCNAPQIDSQKENEYARTLLERIVAYQTKLMTPSEDTLSSKDLDSILSKLDAHDATNEQLLAAVSAVAELGQTAKLVAAEDPTFIALSERIANHISTFSDTQLKELVNIFSKMIFKGVLPNFKRALAQIAVGLMSEIEVRGDVWDTDTLLYFVDFFNHTNRKALKSAFMERFIPLVDTLNKEQTVLLLHNLSICFTSHQRHDLLAKLEEKFEAFIDDCSTQEIGVASLGFYRSRYVPRSETLVEKISQRLLADAASLDEMTVIALVKIINYATRNGTAFNNNTVRENMRHVTQALLPRLRDFSPSSCTNLFRISASLHQLNHNLMDALCQKVIKSDLDEWRLKDLAWFTFTFGQFQCMMDEKQWFYEKIIKSLESFERRTEITEHPNALIQALIGLSLVGIYPNNLLNEVMTPMFRKQMRERVPIDMSRDLFFLDQGVRLERPTYDGCLLPDKFFDDLPKTHEFLRERKLPHEKQKQSRRDEMLLQIQSSLDLLCGRDMCAEIAFVFRHHNTADIVLKVDQNKKPIAIYDWKSTDLATIDKSGQKTIIILVAAPNSFTIYDTEYGYARKLLATHVSKRRQAELLGHTVVEIPYFKWFDRSGNRRQLLIDALGTLVDLEQLC